MEKSKREKGYILVIDDERPVREAISDILGIEGLQVKTAENGEVGVQVYAQNPSEIELVILDLSMPGLSGEETLCRLRSIDPNVKVILSSGYSKSDVSPLISRQTQTAFLAKPYRIDTLLDKVMKFMDVQEG